MKTTFSNAIGIFVETMFSLKAGMLSSGLFGLHASMYPQFKLQYARHVAIHTGKYICLLVTSSGWSSTFLFGLLPQTASNSS